MLVFQTMPGHLVRRMQQIAVAIFAERIGAAGLRLTPVQFAALVAIEDGPGIDQATLAARIFYDRATIGGVVDRLEARGLVARRVSRSDRRARELRLTAEGRALLEAALPIVRGFQAEILGGLEAAEREVFLRLLAKAAGVEGPELEGPANGRTAGMEDVRPGEGAEGVAGGERG